jgi:ABC-2 type transport system ATP-binding protein
MAEAIKPAAPLAVEIKGLYKAYGKKEVIKGLDLEVRKGEVFGFIGKNGVGKSTTIDCAIGCKKFQKGTIKIDGVDILEDPLRAKKKFGYVASEPNCYEVMTGFEYLDFVASIYGVSQVDFSNNAKYLSRRLDLKEDDLMRPISGYSHGMKQKLCLIASLLHRPSVWILDEPTVGLDIMAVEELTKMLKEYAANGQTVLITSHNIDLVSSLCDKVAILNNGVVAVTLDLVKNPNNRLSLRKTFFDVYEKGLGKKTDA